MRFRTEDNRHRYFDPAVGRYISADPIGQIGGLNTYAYAHNSPINRWDPFGLKSQIRFWSGVGWGSSSFGHMSIQIDDTEFSFGPEGMTIEPTDAYERRQAFRDGDGIDLNLTAEEEAQLREFLENYRDEYSSLRNNCTDPIERGLAGVERGIGDSLTPEGANEAVRGSDLRDGRAKSIPGAEAQGPSAPWSPEFRGDQPSGPSGRFGAEPTP